MTPAKLHSFSFFPRLLDKVPQHRRTLYLKAIIMAICLLRSRIFVIPRPGISQCQHGQKVKYLKSKDEDLRSDSKELNDEQLVPVYTVDEDGTESVLVPFKGKLSKVKIKHLSPAYLNATRALFPPLSANHSADPHLKSVKSQMKQLISILRLGFPSIRAKQTWILVLHSIFLVLRTYLSILVAKLDGRIVRDLVSANAWGFGKGIVLWFLLAIPSTYTNSMLRHLQAKLSLHLRTTLTRYAHDLYFTSAPLLRYYRISHGIPSERLDGVDQFITADIAAFCDSLSALYGNIMKPALDMIIFTSQLSRSLGFRGTVLLFVNYYATARILKAVTPAFGKLAAVERGLEGEFRTGMGRVGRESEEIAFYGGGPREREILWNAYLRLIRHVNSIYKIRIAYEWTEDFVIKYAWSAAGYVLISIPILFTRRHRHSIGAQTEGKSLTSAIDDAIANRTEIYISNRRLLLSLADAGGRLMFAYKDILELAGLSSRLYTLFSTLHAIEPLPEPKINELKVALHDVDVDVPGESLRLIERLNFELPSLVTNSNGHCAVKNLANGPDAANGLDVDFDPAWKMKQGEHLMITGPNGVGKTSIARIIAGLWGVKHGAGKLERPSQGTGELMVIPQRAYMVVGTLLDQIIYPHSYFEFSRSGRTLEELMDILKAVHLEYLPAREGGWSTVKEWRDVLSGGEKQRMGLARIFYHKPRFAVLDECTSAVSSDVEGAMYQHAKDLGITLITISLRPSLAKYHTRMLSLPGDGTGKWTITRIGTAEERMGIDKEIVALEEQLAEVGNWEARLKELNKLLGIDKS